MPLKLASGASSISTRRPSTIFFLSCRLCSSESIILRKINAPRVLYTGQFASRRRCTSTASVTAVNARKEILPPFQQLHAALSALKDGASIYINPSQLQLALRGLESKDATTRVAVLGVNGQRGAYRLARALLADPLRPELEWERQLLNDDDGDGRSLLLRYREEPHFDQRHPLLKTLSIPASSLLNHNLEILIQSVPRISGIDAGEVEAQTLVPVLELNSPAARTSPIPFPVHRSVIYARGLRNTPIVPQKLPAGMIKGVIDATWIKLQDETNSDQIMNPINLELAESSINTFRKSLDNGLEYERGWFDSGLAGLSTWFFDGLGGVTKGLKPTVRQLIEALCDDVERAIVREEKLNSQQQAMITIPQATRDKLDQDIASWAEFSHTELRNQLDFWFQSRNWKKLAWWKLYWRVDNISSITSDVLQRAWLVEAEKEMIWLSGRLEQAGLGDPEKRIRRTTVIPPLAEPKLEASPQQAPPASEIVTQLIIDQNRDIPPFESILRPWPQNISRARASLFVTTIPALQTLAQRLLLETFSTNFLTSSLSALLYISLSSSSFSLYEASAVAALGLVYSLRRLQRRWELARDTWEETMRDEGRRLLRGMEARMRLMVGTGGKPYVDERVAEERKAAKKSVENVRDALNGLQE